MKRITHILALAAGLAVAGAASADAACRVEYKAKRTAPFELFYEVVVLPGPCTMKAAKAQLAPTLADRGLTLLKILSIRKQ